MNTEKYLEILLAARRSGTPLVAIECPDPSATVALLKEKVIREDAPIVTWDSIRGWQPVNDEGQRAIMSALNVSTNNPRDAADQISANSTTPLDCLRNAAQLPQGSVLFMFGAHRVISAFPPSTAEMAQACWNLRDAFKTNLRTLVLLGPSFALPLELQEDVFTIEEPYPGEEELKKIVIEVCESDREALKEAGATVPEPPSDIVVARAVDALRGIPAFPAEQAVAMSVNGELNIEELWERKRRKINDTPGLSVYSGTERLEAIGGNLNIKGFFKALINGSDMERAIVFIDEIEKSILSPGGGSGDSGVSLDQLQQLLVWMQDYDVTGFLLTGVMGTGKSAIAKAIGGEAGVPTIAMNLGGFKNSLVGASEARMRAGLRTINAVAGGKVMVIATCNRMASLPAELLRRFQFGTFFFDLPDQDERDAIWTLYIKSALKQEGTGAEWRAAGRLPEEEGWTGAEIRACCKIAMRRGTDLAAASKYIVPVARSRRAQIEELRAAATGCFISASHEGFYGQAVANSSASPTITTRRKMSSNREMN